MLHFGNLAHGHFKRITEFVKREINETFRLVLEDGGYSIRCVDGDGNCLYRAVQIARG